MTIRMPEPDQYEKFMVFRCPQFSRGMSTDTDTDLPATTSERKALNGSWVNVYK